MEAKGWSALIVDDEPPIRAELRYLLDGDGRVGAIEEAGSATEAVERILQGKPDVIFLDISMPGTSGIKLAETLQNLKTPPVVVFVTAYAEHAAAAFELDAVDYVLKPVETERLTRALDKVEKALDARRPTVPEHAQVKRLAVERGGKRAFIPVDDVVYVEAKADYSSVVTDAGSCLVNESISVLENRLAPEGFMRVHRSYLVNLDDVHDVEVARGGSMELTLERSDATIPVSRRRVNEVKERLGL